MRIVLVITVLAISVALAQDDEGLLQSAQEGLVGAIERSEEAPEPTGVPDLGLRLPPPRPQRANLDGSVMGHELAGSDEDGLFGLVGAGGQPVQAMPGIPVAPDPEKVQWERPASDLQGVLAPVAGPLTLLGSTAGGGVTAAEHFASTHGWKISPGLDAVPDHEVAGGLSLPVGRSGRLGLVYRYIQAEARWGTEEYRSGGAAPMRVEATQNHGAVILLRVQF